MGIARGADNPGTLAQELAKLFLFCLAIDVFGDASYLLPGGLGEAADLVWYSAHQHANTPPRHATAPCHDHAPAPPHNTPTPPVDAPRAPTRTHTHAHPPTRATQGPRERPALAFGLRL